MDKETALLAGGARSPTNGSISCGVTVDIAAMKLRAKNTEKEFVRQSPSHFLSSVFVQCLKGGKRRRRGGRITIVAVKKTKMRTKARRLKMSPRGQRKRRPPA